MFADFFEGPPIAHHTHTSSYTATAVCSDVQPIQLDANEGPQPEQGRPPWESRRNFQETITPGANPKAYREPGPA